jgi:hypothetical protein
MIARLSALAALASGMAFAAFAELAPLEAQELSVPSGQPVEFYEAVMDQPAMGLTARFRFLAPELATYLERLSYEELEADLAALCVSYALPRMGTPEPAMIVISLSSAPTEFGTPDPDVAQVFEAYRPAGDHCEWEAF